MKERKRGQEERKMVRKGGPTFLDVVGGVEAPAGALGVGGEAEHEDVPVRGHVAGALGAAIALALRGQVRGQAHVVAGAALGACHVEVHEGQRDLLTVGGLGRGGGLDRRGMWMGWGLGWA